MTTTPIAFPNPNFVPGAAASPSSGTSGTGSAAGSSTLGGTNFLTLMLAQLKNQDPTSPVDSNQFLNQLASLSTVQGITQLTTSFASLSSSLTSNQAMQASTLLGHQVLVSSPTAALTAKGGGVTGAIGVPQTTTQAVLDITDGSGVLVRQISLGPQAKGMASFSWDGKQQDGSQAPAGQYKLTAQISGAAAGTAASTYVNGTVESVTMGAGQNGLTLNVIGLGSVPFASVQQISN